MNIYIVTGSIRPDFHPLMFTAKKAAKRYVAVIRRHSTDIRIKPVIELRNSKDMLAARQSDNAWLARATLPGYMQPIIRDVWN